MKLFKLIFLRSFSDFFPLLSYSEKTQSTRFRVESHNNFWIKNCNFHSLTFSEGNGAAIVCNTFDCYIVTEDCIFSFCSCSYSEGSGCGAIYITRNSITSHIFNRVCAFFCTGSTGSIGQFARIDVGNDSKNEAYFLSISKCNSGTGNRITSIRFGYGSQKILNLNNSDCYCDDNSLGAFRDCISSLIQFSTFKNNKAYIYNGMGIGPTNINISSSNFILNQLGSNEYFLICQNTDTYSSINNCVFYQNLNLNGRLFQKLGGTLSINFCWIQEEFISNGIIINSKLPLTNTLRLTHFGTGYCQSNTLGPTDIIKESITFIIHYKLNNLIIFFLSILIY